MSAEKWRRFARAIMMYYILVTFHLLLNDFEIAHNKGHIYKDLMKSECGTGGESK